MKHRASESASCRVCGKPCVGDDRLTDNKGRSYHRACAKQYQEQRARRSSAAQAAAASQPKPAPEPTPEPETIPIADGGLSGAMLDEVLAAVPVGGKSCPTCGKATEAEAVLCLGCGFNFETGRGTETKQVSVSKMEKAGDAALEAADWPIAMGLSAAGASVGGIIGALVWAGIAYAINYEIGWVAVGVGVACGFGAMIGARHHTGVLSGVMASVVAVVAIFAGKFMVTTWVIDDLQTEIAQIVQSEITMPTEGWMSDDEVLLYLVQEETKQREADGETLMYPGSLKRRGLRQGPLDPDDINSYPHTVVRSVERSWQKLDEQERESEKERFAGIGPMTSHADELAWVRWEAGETMDWPSGMTYDNAYELEHYPPDVIAQAQQWWNELPTEEKRAAVNNQMQEILDAIQDPEFATRAMIANETNPLDFAFNILWIVLAVGAAFAGGAGIASNES